MKIFPLFLLLSCVSAYANIDQDPFKNIQHLSLNNGLQVYLLSDPKAENTQLELTVAVGTEVEDKHTYGLSHLVEHMVFRDKRIPHRDYVDYLKEQGASYVNGYTTRYETGYSAVIDSAKSLWMVEIFAQMLFDKQFEQEDLDSEKGAVQTEIGAHQWTDKLIPYAHFIAQLSPPKANIYHDDFALTEIKQQTSYSHQKINNQTFSFQQVVAHYERYYYPANMVLRISGNFDLSDMKQQLQRHFGNINKTGTSKATKPDDKPRLNGKPYQMFAEGSVDNAGYIGVKYIADDYKKHIVITAYLNNLALRIQQKLRNDLGHTYGVNADESGRGKARVAYIYFDGLRDQFESNIVAVKSAVKNDLPSLSDATINEALKEYKKRYTSTEHDSESLMKLLAKSQFLKEQFSTNNSPYKIFSRIDYPEFRRILNEVFVEQNGYSATYRAYYFFPLDLSVFGVLFLLLMFIAYLKLYIFDSARQPFPCTDRDITLSRRTSNRFLCFIYLSFIYLISTLAWEWFKYLFFSYVVGDSDYLYSIDVPYSYVWTLSEMLINLIFFLLLCRYLFPYVARIAVSNDGILLIGHRIQAIPKQNIAAIDIAPWRLTQAFANTGLSLLFWKPLLKVTLHNGEAIFIRSSHAQHLKEDLQKQLNNAL